MENSNMNWMMQKLYPHVGHNIVCVAYGDPREPDDICIECETCCCVLISCEDFEEDMLCGISTTKIRFIREPLNDKNSE